MESLPGKELFRPDEVAMLAGLSKRTIYRKLARDEITCQQKREGGPLWVPRDSVILLIQERRPTNGPYE